MNRRGFLASLLAAITGSQVDLDRLLWVPGNKLISIPKYYIPRDLNVGPLLTSEMMLDMAMKHFEIAFGRMHSADLKWDGLFVGDEIKVRLPVYRI